LDYQTNVDTDHLPSEALLAAGRISSTIFLALSSAVMFGLGWQFGGRPLAYFASALYTLNPIVLLNGRRAMMEGSTLFLGLLVILFAVVISRKRRQGGGGLWGWWLALILAGGLTVVSKHTGIVFVLAALGWIFVAELFRWRWQPILATSIKLVVSAVLIAAIFIALSPALWNDPPARLQDLITTRAALIDIQVGTNPPMSAAERIASIFVQPFMAPLAHFELTQWSTFEPIMLQAQHYMESPLSGLQFGIALGLPLTFLTICGLVILFIPRLRPAGISWGQVAGMLIWLLGTVAMLMANPLPWQRYYLPLIPLATLLAGIGLVGILRLFPLKRWQQDEIPLVTPGVRAQTE
jgi:4-amino-4-deoxy-L-arabinose transferase-like glycosyltransferase